MKLKALPILWATWALLLVSKSAAQDNAETPSDTAHQKEAQSGSQDDLSKLGLEDLMNVKVGGGTMPLRALKDVTAAVYVLTSEDIVKSGATNVPDMLRLVPGVSVAQVDANKWMVSIRGFSSRYANKLQVLIDGRSVYSPAFSGVFWDQIGLTADEIERIEVIRGSDGSLWGSNAVNGIINIVTKNSADTSGGFLQEGFSSHNAGDHYVRFGGIGKNTDSFRITARSNRLGQSEANTYPATDASESNWINLRSDRKLNKRDSLTVTSSLYTGHLGQSTLLPTLADPTKIVDSQYPVSEFNISTSLVSQYSKKEVSEVKFSYDRNIRKGPEFGLDLADLDFGYNRSSKINESSSVFYGGALRQVNATASPSPILSATPPTFNPLTYSVYGQLERDINPKTQFTLGTTIEHNPISGFEFQPSARLLYRKDPTESYWFSASRAVRTPSPAETNADILLGITQDETSGLPVQIIGRPNRQFESEAVVSIEAGWRKQASDKLLIDVTGFYNSYTNLRSYEFLSNDVIMDSNPHINSSYIVRNGVRARTYGLEASFSSRMSDDWNLMANVTYIGDHFWLRPGVNQLFPLQGTDGGGSVPKWQANLRSSWNLSDSLKFDISGYFTGANAVFGHSAYTRLDTRLEWKLPGNGQITLTGQNLLAPSHFEGTSSFNEIPVNVRRSLILQFGIRF